MSYSSIRRQRDLTETNWALVWVSYVCVYVLLVCNFQEVVFIAKLFMFLVIVVELFLLNSHITQNILFASSVL
jgi:hypothetical protein